MPRRTRRKRDRRQARLEQITREKELRVLRQQLHREWSEQQPGAEIQLDQETVEHDELSE